MTAPEGPRPPARGESATDAGEFRRRLFRRLLGDRGDGNVRWPQLDRDILEMVEQRDARIAAQARAQALREVADRLDITAQECLVDGAFGDYENWINARNVVLIMMDPSALAAQEPAAARTEQDGGGEC